MDLRGVTTIVHSASFCIAEKEIAQATVVLLVHFTEQVHVKCSWYFRVRMSKEEIGKVEEAVDLLSFQETWEEVQLNLMPDDPLDFGPVVLTLNMTYRAFLCRANRGT